MKKKINYPTKRKAADKKECPVCNKLCNARGLKSHLLLAHKLKWAQLTDVNPLLTQVKPKVTRVSNPSILSNSGKKEKKLISDKTDVIQEKVAITQVSPEESVRLRRLPRYSVEQMKDLERPLRTEGLIEVRPEHTTDSNRNLRYCAMANSDFKIKGRVYRVDEIKSGIVPIWFCNTVVLIKAEELLAHFDSVKKKDEWNFLFHEANKETEIR